MVGFPREGREEPHKAEIGPSFGNKKPAKARLVHHHCAQLPFAEERRDDPEQKGADSFNSKTFQRWLLNCSHPRTKVTSSTLMYINMQQF